MRKVVMCSLVLLVGCVAENATVGQDFPQDGSQGTPELGEESSPETPDRSVESGEDEVVTEAVDDETNENESVVEEAVEIEVVEGESIHSDSEVVTVSDTGVETEVVQVVTEKIVFAVNADYAITNADWQDDAQDMIDLTNAVLAQNTNKRYEITEFKTFDIVDWNALGTMPDYHYDNGRGGTTVFYWIDMDDPVTRPVPAYTLLVNVAGQSYIGGKHYQQLYLVGSHPGFNAIDGVGGPNFMASMGTFLHELGHTMGLGVPDWYLYEFDDRSGVEPTLPSYNLRTIYPNDPMSSWAEHDYRFTELNASIINANLRHELGYQEVQRVAATQVRIAVTDTSGQPVPNAVVRVFGGKRGCFYCREINENPLVEMVTTDSEGIVVIAAPSVDWQLSEGSNTPFIGLIIKVERNGAVGGAYVTGQQMQEQRWVNGEDIFPLVVVLG